MRYNIVLLDLDGTITDPLLGIGRAFTHAVTRMGINPPNEAVLKSLIGPPLRDSMRDVFGLSPDEAEHAVSVYREYYGDKGIFECTVYPGVVELMEKLREKGVTLAIATCKATVYAEQIAEHFGFARYLTFIAGCELDGRRGQKEEVIEYALDNLGARERVLMVGDRLHDIKGAKVCGIDSAAVAWGYGNPAEWDGARLVAETPEALFNFICGDE
jgi:phosphoglycolate phosphatase